MGTISVTGPSDGDTIDASDVNTPFNTIVNVINGNIDSNNISAGGVTPANLTVGAGSSWAWQSWTPTLVNATPGNGTLACKYAQIGKTIYFRFLFILGSASSVGTSPTFTLPITSVSLTGNQQLIGTSKIFDSSASVVYMGSCNWASTTTGSYQVAFVSGTEVRMSGLSSTTPMTWATSDELHASGFYEAA